MSVNGSSCLFSIFYTFKKLPISPGEVPLSLLGVTQFTSIPLFIPYTLKDGVFGSHNKDSARKIRAPHPELRSLRGAAHA